MSVSVVIGTQWGDEGKGKIVDLLSEESDIVARYQGGANAGHTICWDDKKMVLHLVPSGIFRKDVTCVIGNGVVIDPVAIMKEINAIRDMGYDIEGRMLISQNAHLIMPYHKKVEEAREKNRKGNAIGTTGRGIGPSYVDKFNRTGIRVIDLLDRDVLSQKLKKAVEEKNAILSGVYGAPELDAQSIIEEYVEFDALIKPYVKDTTQYLCQAIKDGKRVMAEGAQGSLLDIDFGTYPFVTSSHPTVGGCCTGLGVPPTAINRVIGIVKAYCTRVGNGPFPTELNDEIGERLQSVGHEFGATTGRPRRCGWLDLVALGYTSAINGLTELSITKLDVLSGLDEIKVCTAYRLDGVETTQFPSDLHSLERVEPVYETLPGWKEDIVGIDQFDDLPATAKTYVQFIADHVQVGISMVSTGPKRSQTITSNTNLLHAVH
ncbi:MAG: adenylosuccinate synthase [Rhodothermaceae bacterium]|nr:adenylosuccinate synthase [Rhodothermaceae bacterium]